MTVSITDATMARLLKQLEDGDVNTVIQFLRTKVDEGRAKRLVTGKTVMFRPLGPEGRNDAVEAVPVGPLCAHPNDFRGWNVSHTRSGLAAVVGLKSKQLAIRWAHEIAKIPLDWSKDEPTKGISAELNSVLRSIRPAVDIHQSPEDWAAAHNFGV